MSCKPIVFLETFLSESKPITMDFKRIFEYISESIDIKEPISAGLGVFVMVDPTWFHWFFWRLFTFSIL